MAKFEVGEIVELVRIERPYAKEMLWVGIAVVLPPSPPNWTGLPFVKEIRRPVVLHKDKSSQKLKDRITQGLAFRFWGERHRAEGGET